MFKLDTELIKDRFAAASFSFYTDSEIEKLSVKQILNSTAFDHLNVPTKGGIYDKSLGVSPFDHRSTCQTCGLDSNFCPGHVGHIELTAPVYNPFLINHIYKLLKSKCQHCHRLRIHPNKINVYTMCLKLIKSGQTVHSQVLKNYFLNAAKETALISDQVLADSKKLAKFQKDLNDLIIIDAQGKVIQHNNQLDIDIYFRNLDRKFNKMKKENEDRLIELFEEFTTHNKDQNCCAPSSILQKTLKELVHEIWTNVIPTNCPHCQKKSQAIRKDGFTKFFRKAFSEKMKNTIKQEERLNKSSLVKDEGFDVINEGASTTGDAFSRKHSHNEHQSTTHDTSFYQNDDFEDEDENLDNDLTVSQQTLLTVIEIKDELYNLWKNETDLMSILFGRYYPIQEGEPLESDTLGPQIFFLNKLIVTPNRFRPESQGAFGGAGGQSDKTFLHAHSALISKILVNNLALKDAFLDQNVSQNEKAQKWIVLQDSINTFMDSSMASKTADKELSGIRQLLEKKEGMFRMKMMGKRVNYGGRSVISPDPYITTDQIGIPVFMARKLTFPESVSEVNVERLRKLVMNGPRQHPGANMIEDEITNERTYLETLSFEQRRGLAQLLSVGRKIVYRHLTTGDVLLVNRQPTLHKPSIMAHVARILPKEQTIRMHYANCSTYNADFDGDEMNIHFPQNYIACSEAYKLMATHKQYIVPTSGKPIRGLIQDSVVSGVFLSSKDAFLTKEIYHQLVYVGLRELIEDGKLDKVFTLQPTILKPKPLWTGKQVISTILKNIVNQESDYKENKISGLNLDSKSKLSAKEWGPIGVEEGDVIIRDNELLLGTLDKNQFGASEFGMVHSFYEIYGSEKAGDLLTSLARIFTVNLQMHGFTCGLEDLVLTPEYNKKRRMIIEQSHKEGVEAAAKFTGVKGFQAASLNYSNRIVFQSKDKFDKDIENFNKLSIPDDPFKEKQIIQENHPIRKRLEDKMNGSENNSKLDDQLDGAIKGAMSGATSQVLKVCIPDGLVKRFPKNNISAMCLTGAKGGLVNMTQICCMLGQQELEGKRVPKMQNGKTLPCYLPYDPNPRSSGYVSDRFISGLRPQDFFFHCMAGREGLIDTAVKTSRSGYLQRCLIKQLESLVVNYDLTVRDNDGSIIQFLYGEDSIDVINTKFLEKFNFLERNFTSLITNYNSGDIMQKVDQNQADQYKKESKKALKKAKKENPHITSNQLRMLKKDPVMSIYHPLKYFGSISEKMEQQLKSYIDNDSLAQLKVKQNALAIKSKFEPVKGGSFKKMYFLKFMRSIVNPGENVGTLAAQSVGEPSTQMTLNTFHLAGHGAENMTLGIPRLKEILMTTPTHIKTPNMVVYFRKDVNLTKIQMEKYASKFNKIRLSDVIKELRVKQNIIQDDHGNLQRLYQITADLENMKKVEKNIGINFKDIMKAVSDQFIPLLMAEIFKQQKRKKGDENNEETKTSTSRPSKAQKGKQQEKEEDEMIEEEIIKQGSQKSKSKRDEDEDDEEEEIDEDENIMDIDGVLKKPKQLRGYDQEDQEDTEVQRRQSMKDQEVKEEEDQDDISKYCNVFKEKNQKYFGFLRKMDCEENKSITVNLIFPLEFMKILMLTISESLIGKVLLRSVQGIEKCTLLMPEKQNDEPYLLVQGLNFQAFYKYAGVIDVNRIQTNDIWQVKKQYGIEAARANLVKEVRSVFNMYGIEVNFRHLSLIADFITFNGDYRAFNRIGMEESSSPFLKMSFETTMKYLVNSCLTKDTDDLSTPASALVLGQLPKVGTGVFEVIQDPEYSMQ